MLGWGEILFIVSIVVVFFGWRRFPDAARSLGQSIKIFKKELKDNTRDVEEYKGPKDPDA